MGCELTKGEKLASTCVQELRYAVDEADIDFTTDFDVVNFNVWSITTNGVCHPITGFQTPEDFSDFWLGWTDFKQHMSKLLDIISKNEKMIAEISAEHGDEFGVVVMKWVCRYFLNAHHSDQWGAIVLARHNRFWLEDELRKRKFLTGPPLETSVLIFV